MAGGMHGVCYDPSGDGNLPWPRDVVQLCKSHNIHTIRIYRPNPDILKALRRSGIGLILDVGGVDEVRRLADSAAAVAWVNDNVRTYYPDVLIRYIAVGNKVAPGDAAARAERFVLRAMRNVHDALKSTSLSASIKVSTAVRFSDAITNSYPPSSGEFRDPYMEEIARFLADTGAPLLANVYPYYAYKENLDHVKLDYATFELQQQPKPKVEDPNGHEYRNIFHAMVDAMYAALEKAGAATVRVVVSETGWPTGGGFRAATVANAKRYNQAVLDSVYKGTPKRPGVLETYIYDMFKDSKKPNVEKREFGLFNPDTRKLVYPINFPN